MKSLWDRLVDDLTWRRRAQHDPSSLAFDEQWGTETARFDFGNYEPSLPDVVEQALDGLDVGPEGWSFVDLGSGKGRAVLQASLRPFARAVGVEKGKALHRAALANLAAFAERGGPRCPVVFLNESAERAPLPDGPLVVYLYNPFPAGVLLPVLARLADRPLRLVYVHPVLAHLVERAGLVEQCRGGSGDVGAWRIYGEPPPSAPPRTPR